MKAESARRKLNHAVSRGILSRPDTCQRCGVKPNPTSDGRAAIQGHHRDYNKPLEVEWICSKYHRKETPLPEIVGGVSIGSANGWSKLEEKTVMVAKRMRSEGQTYKEIAKKLGVHRTTVTRAIKGELWKHVI